MFTTTLYDMWIDIWGNSTIGALVLIMAFGAFTFKKNYNPYEGASVILPVFFGIILDGSLPLWIMGLSYIGIGILWGLFILRIVGIRG